MMVGEGSVGQPLDSYRLPKYLQDFQMPTNSGGLLDGTSTGIGVSAALVTVK